MIRLWCVWGFVAALALSAGGSSAQPLEVSGRVLDAGGMGLSAAGVELRPLLPAHRLAELQLGGQLHPRVVKRTRTDRDGEFRLDVPAAGFWTVVVRHPEYLPASFDMSPLLIDLTLADLEMRRRSESAARVVDGEGQPVVGATLVVAGWSEAWREATESGWWPAERMGRTDAAGLAALPCDSSETVSVVVVHTQRLLYRETRCEASLLELRLDVGTRVARVIHPDGTPAASAYGFIRWPLLAFGVSDEQGRVRGPVGVSDGVPLAFADADAYYGKPSWLAPAEDDEEAARDETLPTLQLPPTVTVRGRAIDAFDGSPAGDVWLWIGRGTRYFQPSERGSFELRVPRRRGRIHFGGPGYLTIAYPLPAADADDVVVRMTPAMSLPGRVVNARGEGVVDAMITSPTSHVAFGQRPSEARHQGRWQLGTISAITRDDGSFELRRLPPLRRFELKVAKTGFASRYQSVAGLEPGVPAEELVIELERGVTGFGRVVNERDMPIAGAEVALLPSLTGSAADLNYHAKENHGATTSAGGHFTLRDLPAGRYYLSAKAPGFPELLVPGIEVAVAESFDAEGGTEPMDLGTLVLLPGVRLSGRVHDAGEPVAAAQLSLRDADGEQVVVLRNASQWFASTTSRANGSFDLDGLPGDRRLMLLVSADDYLPREMAVVTGSEDQRLEIEISRAARVTGTVLDPTGRPAVGARVQVDGSPELSRLSTATSRRLETDAEGRFEAQGLRPGDYTLRARHDAAKSELVPLRVPAEGLTGVTVELRRKAALAVTLRGPEGDPVARVMVWLWPESASGMPLNQRTDSAGLAVFEPLDAGTYRLSAGDKVLGSANAQVEVEAMFGTPQSFELRFDRREQKNVEPVKVSGRVVDSSGLPVLGARVWLDGEGGTRTSTGVGGEFKLAAAPGEYRFGCRHPDFADYSGEFFTLEADLEGQEIELFEGATVSGRISGLELEDLARLVVVARGPLHETGAGFETYGVRYGTVDFEGRLVIDGVGAGDWMVRAELLNPTRSASERIKIEPGQRQTSVDLHFEAGHRLTGRVHGLGGPIVGGIVTVSCIGEFRGKTFTDDAGRFAVDHVPEGGCTVDATDPESGRSDQQRIEIGSGIDVVLEIRAAGL